MGLCSKHVVPDSDYLLARAAAEVEMADRACSTKASDLHHQLASGYLARVFGDAPPPSLSTREMCQSLRENTAAVATAVSRACKAVTPLPGDADPKLGELLSSL